MHRTLFLIFFVALALSQPSSGAPAQAPEEIVAKLQKAWDETKTFQSDFKQVVFAKRLGTRDESEGKVTVAKPGKLRWETKGSGNLQILNGQKLFVVQENKRRGTRVVDVYSNISQSVDTQALSFLAGKMKFKETYRIESVPEKKKGGETLELKLMPKGDASESLIAEVDKKSYLLRSLTTESIDSRVRIEFSNTKLNPTLGDEPFDFKPGPADIVHKN